MIITVTHFPTYSTVSRATVPADDRSLRFPTEVFATDDEAHVATEVCVSLDDVRARAHARAEQLQAEAGGPDKARIEVYDRRDALDHLA